MTMKAIRNKSIVDEYTAGQSRAALTEKYSLSDISVYRILRDAKVQFRTERSKGYLEKLSARNKSIAEEYVAGQTRKALMQKYNLSKNSFYRILRDEGVQLKEHVSEFSVRDKSIAEECAAGQSREDLAQKYNLSVSSIVRVLLAEGVQLGDQYFTGLSTRNKDIVDDHVAGLSSKALAKKYELSVTSVNRILRDEEVAGRISGIERSARSKSILEEHSAGLSREVLAQKYSLTKDQVYRVLFKEGISVQDDKSLRDRSIVEEYTAGMSAKDVAKNHSLSPERIFQILRSEGAEIRDRYPDLAGKVFSRLTVLKRAKSARTGERKWLCHCSCGKECSVRTASLTLNTTKSCGCLQKEGRPIKHGQARRGKTTLEYVLLKGAKVRAKKRGVPFSLKLDDIHIPEKCPVFGTPLQSNKGKQGPDSPSIDRLIPELGYVPGNVKVISYRANRIKQDASPEELRTMADWIEDSLAAGGHEDRPGTLTPPHYIKKYDLRKGPRSNLSKISKEVSNASDQ